MFDMGRQFMVASIQSLGFLTQFGKVQLHTMIGFLHDMALLNHLLLHAASHFLLACNNSLEQINLVSLALHEVVDLCTMYFDSTDNDVVLDGLL